MFAFTTDHSSQLRAMARVAVCLTQNTHDVLSFADLLNDRFITLLEGGLFLAEYVPRVGIHGMDDLANSSEVSEGEKRCKEAADPWWDILMYPRV